MTYSDKLDFSQKQYIYRILANYCMPTLLKLKPSSMFNVNKSYIRNPVTFFAELERELTAFECSYFILFESGSMYLILIYNRAFMTEMILDTDNRHFLDSCGYDIKGCMEVSSILVRLKGRYMEYWLKKSAFPHEVGILLGYPLWDVEDFIRNNGENYLLNGCWKVYHEVKRAEETFRLYHKVSEDALQIIRSGENLKDVRMCNKEECLKDMLSNMIASYHCKA
ncbi:MAG TPA: DUF3793 family protein [Mobilitalea sp.]|nr:DUF3793 family protein [Mobilitalea sp.]